MPQILTTFYFPVVDTDAENIKMLGERFKCPYFRILVIGRANAGKTTILEKVCGADKGTEPIIYDKDGKLSQYSSSYLAYSVCLGSKLEPTEIHLMPSIEVSQALYVDVPIDVQEMIREEYMRLNIKLHMKEATSFFMILKVLRLVEVLSWKLFGHSLRGSPIKLR